MPKITRQSLRISLPLLLIVCVLAVIAHLSPVVQQFEENIGLNGLFELRGPRAPPDDVLIISIDRRSADQLDLPSQLRKWPRDIYAKLVDILERENASVIGFDVFFREEKKQENNIKFAKALESAGNVVLFEFLKKDQLNIGDSVVEVETLVKPLPILAAAAAATGVFPLPRVSASVSQVWLFKPEINEKATLPVVMHLLQQQSVQLKLLGLIEKTFPNEWPSFKISHLTLDGNSIDSVQLLRQFFLQKSQLKKILLTALSDTDNPFYGDSSELTQLINLYSSPHSRYLNFYGPRHTIKTIPIFKILKGVDLENIRRKAIFIGFSDSSPTEEKDDFITLYSSQKESLIAGVEIAATQFSNIVNDEFLVLLTLGESLLLYFSWALILVFLCANIRAFYIVPVALFASMLFVFASYQLFVNQYIWLPLIIPLLLQMPLIVILFLGFRYHQLQQEKRNIREAFAYYLPSNIIAQLEKDASSILNAGQSTFGVCLSTDVEQYTTLSEKTYPVELHHLMNRYFKAIFEPVREKQGYVSDVVGDAMLAIWLSPDAQLSVQTKACEAALGIRDASELFNKDNKMTPLPTRVGLHCGEIVVGNVGGGGRYEYRAVGDIVNTASRLESLNKVLGTRILISGDLHLGASNIHTRALGNFVLKGKHNVTEIHELLCLKKQLSSHMQERCIEFQLAKKCFMAGSVLQAQEKFMALIEKFEQDGPSEFYLQLCDIILKSSELGSHPYRYDSQTGIIHMLSKG